MVKAKENKKASQLPGIYMARQADVPLAPSKAVTITVVQATQLQLKDKAINRP